MIFKGYWHSHQSEECFPRDEGWEWNLPKMYAFAKMPHKMLKFGSANIISGNIGDRALKGIMKDHAEKTPRQQDKFAEQCAIREYESNLKLGCQLIPLKPTMK
jgi:hypothetical protein